MSRSTRTGRDRPPRGVRFVHVRSERANELADLVSRYNDLTFVVNAGLRLLRLMSDPDSDITLIRALWTAMVTAYGRCFGKGRLRVLRPAVVKRITARWPKDHATLLYMRDKQIAHAVDDAIDRVIIAVGYSQADGRRSAETFAIYQNRNLAWPPEQVLYVVRQAHRVRKELAKVVKELQEELVADVVARGEQALRGKDVSALFEMEGSELGRAAPGPLGGWLREHRPERS